MRAEAILFFASEDEVCSKLSRSIIQQEEI